VRSVSWGAAFPDSWPRTRIKHISRFAGGGTPDKGKPEYWNGDIPWVSPKDMKAATIVDTEDHITEEGLASSATKLVAPGAVLLVMRSGILRHSIPVAINRVPVALNQDMRALTPIAQVDARYLSRLLEGHQQQLLNAWSKVGSTVESLESDLVGETEIAVPPLAQQRAIADYLDRETARLDALVAAKQRVLGLLAEKRRALITRAVTRGLDPRAPLRDSGIPWLGEIPAHWETSKFTWSVFIVEGQVDPEVEPYCDMSLIAPNHVESGTGRLLGQETAGDQGAISGKYHCRRGDVIYSKIRPALRKATIAIEECLCSADMYPLRARDRLQPEFLLLYLLSEPFTTWAVLESNRVAMPKINREALSEIRIPVPSPAEQSLIVAHVQDATARIDSIRSATEGTLALLKERRAALIAAAVTGQLEVA